MGATLRKKGRRYIVTVHANGRRKEKSFPVKREAEREMNRANNALNAGKKIETTRKKDTLNFYVERWFKLVVRNKNAPCAHGTIVQYTGIYKNKIQDGLGKKDINLLTRPFLMSHCEDLMMDDHSKSDIAGRLLIVNGGLQKAADNGHGPGPHKGLIKSLYPGRRHSKKKIDTFSLEEEKAILANTKLYAPTLMLFRTGMRLGEICGLDFSAVNFNEKYIVVRQSYRNGRLSTATKTGVERVVPLDDEMMQILKDLRIARNEARLKGVNHQAVFLWKNKRLAQGTFRYVWKRCLEKCGIDHRKPHCVRHSVATRLLDAGNSTKLVAELLGHSVQTLLSVYTHKSKGESDKKRQMLLALNAVSEENTRQEIINY